MFGRACKVCEAKDKEIEHLLALLERANAQAEKAVARLSEIQSPGVNARLEPRPVRPMSERRVAAKVQGFPGYAPESPQQGIEVEP